MSIKWDYDLFFHYAVAFAVFSVISFIILRIKLITYNARLTTELVGEKIKNERIAEYKSESELLKKNIDSLQKTISSQQIIIVEQKTRMSEEKKHTDEKLEILNNVKEEMTEKFKSLASQIFEEKGRNISAYNLTGLKEVLSPFENQINRFKQKVEDVYVNGVKEQSSLKKEIENLYLLNRKLNTEASNLTRALKGDNKIQGQWGEMVLERILEMSGLRKGMEYDSQPGHRDSTNKLFKPDIVIHLPGERDVIIDSKVSLLDYEKYTSGTDKEEQDYYLKKHIKAIKTHIKELSGKDYSDLEGIKSLDFILMFMPIEGAFALAFQNDRDLFDYSYRNKIVVTAPTTLMATLKTMEHIWKFEYQNRNTMVIAEKAGIVYDKLRGFVDDMERLGKQMNTANTTYNDAFNKLSKGRGNLVDQANEFIELGIKVKKKIQIN